MYLNFKPESVPEWEVAHSHHRRPMADSFDWRNNPTPVVTPVKDQAQCGSCWAFSVTENTESMWALAGHTLAQLSPQQIVDCDTGDSGCNGGNTDVAFKYIIGAGGLQGIDSYPYTSGQSGQTGTCQFDATKIVATVRNFTYSVPPCVYVGQTCDNQDENAVQQSLVSSGPLSVCVNAGPWQDYSGGVFTADCPHAAANINHCVQLVGYDNTDTSNPYWMVRNSWGQWGSQGYIYLQKGVNACGIANQVTFANI